MLREATYLLEASSLKMQLVKNVFLFHSNFQYHFSFSNSLLRFSRFYFEIKLFIHYSQIRHKGHAMFIMIVAVAVRVAVAALRNNNNNNNNKSNNNNGS